MRRRAAGGAQVPRAIPQDCMMNLPDTDATAVSTEALADAASRVTDYGPRNRLEPKWRPGMGMRPRITPEPVNVADPWRHDERSMAGETRLPGQRTMLLLLVLTGVSALGLISYGMSGLDDGQRWSAPAARVQQHADVLPTAAVPLPAPGAAPSRLAHADDSDDPADTMAPPESGASVLARQSQDRRQSILSGEADVTQLRTAPAAVAAPEALAGVRSSAVLPVTRVSTTSVPTATAARAEAGTELAPAAMSTTRVLEPGRSQRSGPTTVDMECSQVQQAMQLCGITESSRR